MLEREQTKTVAGHSALMTVDENTYALPCNKCTTSLHQRQMVYLPSKAGSGRTRHNPWQNQVGRRSWFCRQQGAPSQDI